MSKTNEFCALGLLLLGIEGCSVDGRGPGVFDEPAGEGEAPSEALLPNRPLEPDGGAPCVDGDSARCGPAGEAGRCVFGVSTCSAGAWGECQGAVLPAPRDCTSAEDNDCDGQPDDTLDAACVCAAGSVRPCGEHPGLDGRGPCRAGQQQCVVAPGNATSDWGACTGSVRPGVADACEVPGDDSDCDGSPNGGCPCVDGDEVPCGPATEDGICLRGVSTCVGSAFSTCVGAVFPGRRDCGSAQDNDCDGRPDDTVDNVCTCTLGEPRVCGEHPGLDGNGRCQAGSRTCLPGLGNSTSAFGACEGSVGPASAELCGNATDDDCNGEADEAAACNPCTNNPCQNGGSCRPTLDDYSCTCRGFLGKNCEQPLFELVAPLAGHAECMVYTLTDDGSKGGGVCYTPTPSGPPSAPVVWRSGLPFLQLPSAPSYYISGDGAVLAEFDARSAGGTIATLASLNGRGIEGLDSYSAHSVNRDGSIITGSAFLADFSNAQFRWSLAGGFEVLPTEDERFLANTLVSSDGSTVVGADAQGAYRYTTSAGLETLVPDARATGVSANGSVVGGVRTSGYSGPLFRWTAATGAVDLASDCTTAFVSLDGAVISAICIEPSTQEQYVEVVIGNQRARLVEWLIAAGAANIPPRLEVLWAMSGDGKTFIGQSLAPDASAARPLWVARLP